MFEANFLAILLKPNYEKAVDTAEDVLDRGLEVIFPPGGESIVEMLKNSPDEITRKLGERTTICKTWDECDTGNENNSLRSHNPVLKQFAINGLVINQFRSITQSLPWVNVSQ